jgi:hypothetical protein
VLTTLRGFGKGGAIIVFFLFLIFPTENFNVRYIFEFILLISILPWVVFNKKDFSTVLMISIGLLFILTLRFAIGNNISELNDLARMVTPLLVLGFIKHYVPFNKVLFISVTILVINTVIVSMYANGYENSLLQNYVYSVKPELSHGRNSGIFSNIAILGVMSAFFMITSYVALLERSEFKKTNKIIILLSSYCLIMSQSKTSILLGLFLIIMISTYYAVMSKRKYLPLSVIGVLTSATFFLYETIADKFYTFYKLLNADSIWNISSMVARFDYWIQYEKLITANFYSLFFGVERSLMNNVGSTFDNDYIWIAARFGFLFLVIYLGFLLYKSFQLLNYKKYSIECRISIWLTLYTLFASMFIGIIASPPLLGYLLLFYNNNQIDFKRVT